MFSGDFDMEMPDLGSFYYENGEIGDILLYKCQISGDFAMKMVDFVKETVAF
jgi:hypothetical protein